jgi:hypothetical protein
VGWVNTVSKLLFANISLGGFMIGKLDSQYISYKGSSWGLKIVGGYDSIVEEGADQGTPRRRLQRLQGFPDDRLEHRRQ